MPNFKSIKKWLASFLARPDSVCSVRETMKLVNLGCGYRYHPDWINVDSYPAGPDVIVHNLKNGLPFSDNEFDIVYHSHLLEHLSKNYTPVFLGECRRILKPGGIIRVVVPDLEQIARLYLTLLEQAWQGNVQAQEHYDWILIELLDQLVRHRPGGDMLDYWKQNPMPAEDFVIERVGSEVLASLAVLRATDTKPQPLDISEPDAQQVGTFRLSGEVHLWMYDRYSLKKLLQVVGFENIQVLSANESNIPGFNAYLLDIEANGSVRKPDSLFMEAKKPRA